MYAIFAQAFPTHVRATGTGFAIGVGRGGSVLAPIVAGFLFQANLACRSISMIMALGSLLAAGVLTFLKLSPDAPEAQPAEKAGAPAGDLGRRCRSRPLMRNSYDRRY